MHFLLWWQLRFLGSQMFPCLCQLPGRPSHPLPQHLPSCCPPPQQTNQQANKDSPR
ncbi:hypothetical protein E2C01_072882 [Portunus trituberculatus]|uniref:Uncharacterized protein n=1 Tax=Portunus trituberculatus TaxID=210409 RepID=A0A5B7IA50_PORTR|nr:hypothetical protein [Portunus trituberculatus]